MICLYLLYAVYIFQARSLRQWPVFYSLFSFVCSPKDCVLGGVTSKKCLVKSQGFSPKISLEKCIVWSRVCRCMVHSELTL